MLSEENRKRIVKNGIYKAEPWLTTSMGTYHCMNWCFVPRFLDNGDIYMVDTYFDDWESRNTTKLTDENIDKFMFQFVKGEYKRAGYEELRLYDEKDIIENVAIDSGGYSCEPCNWVRKKAKPSKEKLLQALEQDLEYAKYNVKSLEEEIEKCKKGTHWKLL